MDFDGDDQAMAQALGFSSFGAQDRPQKKRKYNPHADASGLVAQTRAKATTTGSNSTPLGASARLPASQPSLNNDEIALDDEDGTDGGAALDMNAGQEVVGNSRGESEPQAQVRPHGLPQRPPPAARQQMGHNDGRHHGDIDKRSPWFEGYYDPSSNENPWRRLEDSLGLQSKGSWLSRNTDSVQTR